MEEPVAKSLTEKIKAGVATGAEYGRQHGSAAIENVVRHGRAGLKTKTGKRIATGVLAGGAIGGALPFISIAGGAMLGAGALVLWKSIQDRE